MTELGYLRYIFHIGRITARTENASNLGVGLDIVGCDERACRVVDDRAEFDRNCGIAQTLAQHLSTIMSFCFRITETLGPADKLTVINTLLNGGETEREPK